jgi:hypothetical protein
MESIGASLKTGHYTLPDTGLMIVEALRIRMRGLNVDWIPTILHVMKAEEPDDLLDSESYLWVLYTHVRRCAVFLA